MVYYFFRAAQSFEHRQITQLAKSQSSLTFVLISHLEFFKMATESSNTEVPSPLASDERTCHALPCNIDYQGMAPTHVYFRPVESEDGVYSSMFRGRGLLSTKNDKVKAALISTQNDQLQVKAEMDNILEWHHEHHLETLRFETGAGRVRMAQEWLEVADAVSDVSFLTTNDLFKESSSDSLLAALGSTTTR
jgi:hypothetical protein